MPLGIFFFVYFVIFVYLLMLSNCGLSVIGEVFEVDGHVNEVLQAFAVELELASLDKELIHRFP